MDLDERMGHEQPQDLPPLAAGADQPAAALAERLAFGPDRKQVSSSSCPPYFHLLSIEMVAHNAAFEAEFLAAAGIRITAPIRCTMQGSSLLS
jgi:hypothetical protein